MNDKLLSLQDLVFARVRAPDLLTRAMGPRTSVISKEYLLFKCRDQALSQDDTRLRMATWSRSQVNIEIPCLFDYVPLRSP
mgnify:CR=1 FL=1